jgi:succinyl-CoA synthetase alpha subunit
MTLHSLAFIHANTYKDSVALMRVAQRLQALPDVVNATLQMGNPANKAILQDAGLLSGELDGAGPSDIMVAIQARSRAACEAAGAECKAQLAGTSTAAAAGAASDAMLPHTLGMARATLPGANIAQISVPGPYAAAEALKALQLGLNVFMFSDNVPVAQEVALKQEAARRGLLVMGPDCGTALVGGVPLGFANNVRRGSIGLVAASGTGLQEVTTQIHRMGGGVSHAIGTGGRDVHAQVGAATMLQGIALLADDPSTRVIAIVSKPPAPEVSAKVMAALQAAGKPAVVLFLGSAMRAPARQGHGVQVVDTLVDCAAAAVKLAGIEAAAPHYYAIPPKPQFAASQQFLRALYSGGTFASEAQILWARAGLKVRSNVPLDPALALADARKASVGHTVLDLGDDAFTVGRPHPMIDQAARVERLLREAADPSVRVIVLDVVMGWGAHPDPAADLAVAVAQARRIAAKGGRELAVIGFVCGTESDPQGLARQEATLRAVGMVLAGNSANAAWLAGEWVK